MTVNPGIDLARLFEEQLAQASPESAARATRCKPLKARLGMTGSIPSAVQTLRRRG